MDATGRKLWKCVAATMTAVVMMGATESTTVVAASGIGLIDKTGLLDIHVDANESSEVAGQVVEEGHVAIIEKNGEWIKIQAGDIQGWVPALYVVETEVSHEEAVEANEQIIAEMTESIQNLRQEEEQEQPVQSVWNDGNTVTVGEAAGRTETSAAAIPVSSQEAQPQMAVSPEELKLLANIIYCEAGSEPYEGKVAVGSVVLNRVKSSEHPNTITEVIYAKGQFTPVRNGSLRRALASDKADAACYRAATEALGGAKPVGDKKFFRRVNGRPGQIIGQHVFYGYEG